MTSVPAAIAPTDSAAALDRLAQIAQDVLSRCRQRGASQAEVGASDERGLSVSVRMDEVETIEHTRDRGLSITVYFGQRKGSASTGDLDPVSIETSIDQACAIARHTEQDEYAGLAPAEAMATRFPDLDLWHPWALDVEAAIELGRQCEGAGRAHDARVSNSEGAQVVTGASIAVYANSHGFLGRERNTHHSISCSLIAGKAPQMQRDYWYTTACAPQDLEAADAVGRRAAERAVERLGPRPVPTGEVPVLLVPEVARSLVSHLVSAVSGGALYRGASFLLDSAGQRLFPDWMDIQERPHLPRGHRSANFDAEGVATRESPLVQRGVLERYVLGSYSARRLGLETTGNAGGTHNLVVAHGNPSFQDLVRGMGRGLVVTELMGQGVNLVTGDYSRGAAGFWVENGELAFPVDEVTIAGKLRQMFQAIEAVGSDVDPRSQVLTGSILLGRMMVAGAS
ncbi:MAG TPA: metalloprotease PmbA [Xanthomonadaceae bacterium]|nr:metalloprotease PmbA [Xanthomonadaceae bacterium]